MLLYLGKCAGFEVVCDKCDFSEVIDDKDNAFLVRHVAREKGWRIRIEPNGLPMEGGYVYLCPKCRQREESYPSKGGLT